MFDNLVLRTKPDGSPVAFNDATYGNWSHLYDGFSNPDGWVNSYTPTSQARTLAWLHAAAVDPTDADALWALVWMGDRGLLPAPSQASGHNQWEWRFDHGGWDAIQVKFANAGCARVTVATKIPAYVQFEHKLLPV